MGLKYEQGKIVIRISRMQYTSGIFLRER